MGSSNYRLECKIGVSNVAYTFATCWKFMDAFLSVVVGEPYAWVLINHQCLYVLHMIAKLIMWFLEYYIIAVPSHSSHSTNFSEQFKYVKLCSKIFQSKADNLWYPVVGEKLVVGNIHEKKFVVKNYHLSRQQTIVNCSVSMW